MEPHKPAQTTRFPQSPNLLDLGFAFNLVLNISPQGLWCLYWTRGRENMGTEEIPLLLQMILNHSSRERRAEWMQAVLEDCFACQLPPLPSSGSLNFSKAWLDAHFHFKNLPCKFVQWFRDLQHWFLLKTLTFYSLHIHLGSSIQWERVKFTWCCPGFKQEVCRSRFSLAFPTCYLPEFLYKPQAKTSERQIFQSLQCQNGVSLFLSGWTLY